MYFLVLVFTDTSDKYVFFDHVDCSGHTFKKLGKTSLDNCKYECDLHDECKSFQFNTVSECYLKNYGCSKYEMIKSGAGRIYNKKGK